MAVTLADVAQLAGVSTSAVSRTFTAGASVSDKTRRKVLKAADELGYTPNVIARSLATSRTQLIGLVIDNFQNPIFLEVLEAFTQLLQSRGLRPLLVNLSGETEPVDAVRMLRAYRVDAAIVASSTLPTDFALAFKAAGLPVVNVFGRYCAAPDFHVVGIDNQQAGRLATETLISRGYRQIGFLGGPAHSSTAMDRQAGFEQAMREAGLEPALRHHAAQYSYEAGTAAMGELMDKHTAFDALVCGDDLIGIAALTVARSAGKAVPDALGLIGFNNLQMASWEAFELSTVAQPTEQLCASTVTLLDELLADPERPVETRLLPCRVIERGTLRTG